MVNKKAVVIATVIMIIIVGVILVVKIYKLNNEENIELDTVNETSKTKANDASEGAKEENAVKEDNTLENTITDNNEEENITNTTNTIEVNNTITEDDFAETKTKEDPEELAEKLAKDKWGNTNNVYFSIDDEVSKGVYIVSVRDENSTAQITSYKVDINKKTVVENQ